MTAWVTRVIVLLLCDTCCALEVTAPPTQMAFLHSPALLPCSFRTPASSIDPQFLAIIWSLGDKQLVRFDNKEKEAAAGFSIDESEARKGNASLTIRHAAIADEGNYECLVIYSPDRERKAIGLSVYATPEVTIQGRALRKDDHNQVHCSVSGFHPREVKVTWVRNNIEVLAGSEMGGLRRDADGTYRVNSSITLTPAQIQDRPSIGCRVEHVSLQGPIQDGFTVTYGVTPKVRLTSSRSADRNELIYVCEARGFSPEAVSMHWYVDGRVEDLFKKSEQGVFNREIYYHVDIQEGNVPKEISCGVQHETMASPFIDTLQVDSFNECTQHCHLGLTALLALLLSGAIAFITFAGYLIIKKKYLSRFQVSHIHRQQTLANEDMVTLHCMALKCAKRVEATWIVQVEGREDIAVSDCQTYKDAGSGSRLRADYPVKTEQTEWKGLKNVTTMLTFNPATTQYKTTKVQCKLVCGGTSKERSLICTFEQKRPEMKDSIKVSFDESKNIVCSATLESFYPKNVHIQWSFGAEQYNDVVSTNQETTHNATNRTYSLISECKIPSSLLSGPMDLYKVRVMWRHSSMDHPESRETTLAAEIPHRPVMEDLVIPSLLHDTEAKLTCDIRGFFPDNLEVTWLRREPGSPELYVLSSSDKYKIPVIESAPQTDKTFTCTASIIVHVSGLTDHGSEVICRVTHPSLETHLEKSGKLQVKGIPEIEIKYIEKTLRATISNYTPNKISITWRRTREKKMENYKANEIRVVEARKNDDGTFTSVQEVSVNVHKEYKKYEVIVDHECLKSPTRKEIIRKEGKFSVMENGQNLECEDTSGGKETNVAEQDTTEKQKKKSRISKLRRK